MLIVMIILLTSIAPPPVQCIQISERPPAARGRVFDRLSGILLHVMRGALMYYDY